MYGRITSADAMPLTSRLTALRSEGATRESGADGTVVEASGNESLKYDTVPHAAELHPAP